MVLDQLVSLNFYGEKVSDGDYSVNSTMIHQQLKDELLSEKKDYFSDLSGGQQSKIELVRTVFQEEHCPDVLLLDETMAALDPSSKTIVMSKLKEFCSESIVLVIYHGDSMGEDENACVQGNNFFDSNLHLDNGNLIMRSTC
eukprot:CAMPEP_0196817848 /NCGR_PEP_ID=MMETSP1362-20130617/62852_1 /TAXON_ID=163516 /ORGANISM="Leptocylindrus danicus, Strain CCMP1856" /LENGTH=141 /DNA_ID=CAMNT_0042195711 /DNA_START=162 /DNA_END=587 /DNA_ORIENTATION=+